MKNKNNSMHEVAIVYKRPLFNEMPHIRNSEDGYSVIKKSIDLDTLDYKEFFWVLLLNNANRVLGVSEIGRGDAKGVIVNVKEIFQLVLKSNAIGIILCHNHPSGNLNASASDITMTEKIKSIVDIIGVTLIDHIIITSEHYYSFADEGML